MAHKRALFPGQGTPLVGGDIGAATGQAQHAFPERTLGQVQEGVGLPCHPIGEVQVDPVGAPKELVAQANLGASQGLPPDPHRQAEVLARFLLQLQHTRGVAANDQHVFPPRRVAHIQFLPGAELQHQGHIDALFDRLIEDLIVLEGIDPSRVYLMGYSAGGDGVFQLAPRMADRWGAAAMMAGHPNETVPDGLRNLAFTLHMGGEDGSYGRNKMAGRWRDLLAGLHERDPGGYEHWVEIHAGKGHWMDREDGAALPWMATHSRNLRPEKIVWVQDDVTHKRFYWLAVDKATARSRLVVSRRGQKIEILEARGVDALLLRLDDSMLDLDQTVTVSHGGETLYEGRPLRRRDVLARTLAERGDPTGVFCAEVRVQLPAQDEGGDRP